MSQNATEIPQVEKELVSAEYLLKEAPREKHFITGAQAMAEEIGRAHV